MFEDMNAQLLQPRATSPTLSARGLPTDVAGLTAEYLLSAPEQRAVLGVSSHAGDRTNDRVRLVRAKGVKCVQDLEKSGGCFGDSLRELPEECIPYCLAEWEERLSRFLTLTDIGESPQPEALLMYGKDGKLLDSLVAGGRDTQRTLARLRAALPQSRRVSLIWRPGSARDRIEHIRLWRQLQRDCRPLSGLPCSTLLMDPTSSNPLPDFRTCMAQLRRYQCGTQAEDALNKLYHALQSPDELEKLEKSWDPELQGHWRVPDGTGRFFSVTRSLPPVLPSAAR